MQTVTHSLYNLATYPEYVQPLREEIEAVIQEQGWSKASVTKMTKLDSFVKETMRLSPTTACTYLICHHFICSKNTSADSMRRRTTKDFTFSDGTTIPAGNFLSVAIPCIHTDPVKMSRRYPNFVWRVYAYRIITSTLKPSTAYALKRCGGKRTVSCHPSTRWSRSTSIIYCSAMAVMRGTHISFSSSLT